MRGAKQEPAARVGDPGRWMKRTARLVGEAEKAMDENIVHELRITLRRTRSLTGGIRSLDKNPDWRKMQAEAKKVFRTLSRLRDTQVLIGLAKNLAPPGDAVAKTLVKNLRRQEKEQRGAAGEVLSRFKKGRWLRRTERLTARLDELKIDKKSFERLALDRLEEARAMHRRALRNRNKTAFHELRITIKRFRYTVEMLLPEKYALWGDGLKRVQDCLGEYHDLDVLWNRLQETARAAGGAPLDAWKKIIAREEQKRLAKYRALMAGPKSLWIKWRKGIGQQ